MSENSENQEDEVKGDQASLRTKNSGVEIYRKWRLTGIHFPNYWIELIPFFITRFFQEYDQNVAENYFFIVLIKYQSEVQRKLGCDPAQK